MILASLGIPYSVQPVEMLVQLILQYYMSQTYCVTVVSDTFINIKSISTVMSFINPSSRDHLIDQILAVSEMGCSDYIVQISEPEHFIAAYDAVNHLGILRRSDKKIIFLPSESLNRSTMLSILKLKETAYAANVLLIVPEEKERTDDCIFFYLITHKYVGPDEQVQDPIILDQWDSCSQKLRSNSNLFPHDMKNLEGKSLKVACFTYEPYVLLDLDTSVAPFGRDGTEIRIIDEFCRWVNCTVNIIRDDFYEWGEIFENGTGNGILGNIVEDRADVGVAALYSWYDSYRHLDFSASCIRSGISAIAPAPRLLVSWELPLLAFSWVMWMTLLFTFIFASLALWIAQGSSDKVLLTTFGMMVTQSQKDAGESWRVRSITGWILITGLILDNAYGGGLAATFTVPRFEKSIDTVQDIVDVKMPWAATHDAWVFSLVLSQEPKIMQLVSQFQTLEADVLKEKSFSRSMAFGVEKLPGGYFAIGEYITKEAVLNLELMLEDFYYEQTVVMARKSSPYTAKITDLIGRLHETGLLRAWETQVVLKYLDYDKQVAVKFSRSPKEADIVPLGIKHVVGIFSFYVVGVVISTIIFLTEQLMKSRLQKII